MASIRHNAGADRLPDLVNRGVVARIVMGACVVGLIAALARSRTLDEFAAALLAVASAGLLPLLLNILALGALSRWLRTLPYPTAIACVIGITLAVSVLAFHVGRALTGLDAGRVETHVLYTLIIVVLLLAYFDLRGRALSPAVAESRLQALQARIRPHFLFNSINAVLSLIRSDPKRAETALEDMAELFRVLMADNRELTPLAREVELCRQYLDLEELRLGNRLKVEWFVDKMPEDALVPPLVLQPLLENAVYHGIEPRTEPGVISINIYRRGDRVHAVLRNPYQMQGSHHAGNKMAVGNIRERLSLHFDAEASLDTSVENHAYQVHITLPYRKASSR